MPRLRLDRPSATDGAQPIPGPHSDRLAAAAQANDIHVVAGLVERAGDRLYNAALLIDPEGRTLWHHRKLNELDIGRALYDTGDRLGIVETELGTIGVCICADNYWDSRAVGHVLCRMGAQLILSPSAWAVAPEHDEEHDPYGGDWLPSFTELARLYDVTVIGVSNVGMMTGGPWAGRPCIGKSLAVGAGGDVLAGTVRRGRRGARHSRRRAATSDRPRNRRRHGPSRPRLRWSVAPSENRYPS